MTTDRNGPARTRPPSGEPAPASVGTRHGESVELLPLAQEICRRYRREYPDEQARYGNAGHAWCVHDNQYLLYWSVEDADGVLDLETHVAWLANVLESRDFPLDRLARGLEIGADVVRERLVAKSAREVSDVMSRAAEFVRSRARLLESDTDRGVLDEGGGVDPSAP